MRYNNFFYYVISSMLIFSTAPPNDDNRLAEHSPCSHNKSMSRKPAHSHFCCDDPYHCRPPTLPSRLFSGVCANRCLEGGTRIRYQMICSMKIKQNKTTWWNSLFYSDPCCHLSLTLPTWPLSDVGARRCWERGTRIRLLDGMYHY